MRLPLVGPRIELRAFRRADVAEAHRIFTDPEVMRYVGNGPVRQRAETEAMISAYMGHQRRHGFSFWAVVDRASGQLVGDAGLFCVEPAEVELGFTLARAWWGRGYATEAGRLCVEAAFGELGLPELHALVEPPNAGSRGVLEKLGFQPEGRRQAYGREHLHYRLTPAAAHSDSSSSEA